MTLEEKGKNEVLSAYSGNVLNLIQQDAYNTF